MQERKKYQICLVSFSEPFTDARTLNLLKVLKKKKYSICLLALGDSATARSFKALGIDFFPIAKSDSKKAWIRWSKFIFDAKAHLKSIDAEIYYACDMYSLPVAKDLYAISTAKRKYLIYDSREIYSELGPLSDSSMKQMAISKAEKIYIKSVDEIVVSGENDMKYLKTYFEQDYKYHIIKNLPPFKNIIKSNIIREKFEIPKSDLILIYQGEILPGRGLVPVLKAMKLTQKVSLVIFGDGPMRNQFETASNKLGLEERVHFAGKVPYAQLHEWTCSADIGICLFEPISLSYKFALPNKLFEYAMAGVPSLITDLPAMQEENEKYDLGILIPEELDYNEISKQIEALRDESLRNKFKENCKRASMKISYESQEKEIINIFKPKLLQTILDK